MIFIFMYLLGNASALRVEDVVPIATGHEREELEAELQVSIFFWLDVFFFINQR